MDAIQFFISAAAPSAAAAGAFAAAILDEKRAHLPRQARDKHRKRLREKAVSAGALGGRSD